MTTTVNRWVVVCKLVNGDLFVDQRRFISADVARQVPYWGSTTITGKMPVRQLLGLYKVSVTEGGETEGLAKDSDSTGDELGDKLEALEQEVTSALKRAQKKKVWTMTDLVSPSIQVTQSAGEKKELRPMCRCGLPCAETSEGMYECPKMALKAFWNKMRFDESNRFVLKTDYPCAFRKVTGEQGEIGKARCGKESGGEDPLVQYGFVDEP